jgi:DNA repair exonuclease SbcCD nuclease subunit
MDVHLQGRRVKYPYAISSDQHCHAWSAFCTVGTSGINSRLETILSELERSYAELRRCSGQNMFLAGDLFHQRGEIKPSVFNPTYSTFREISEVFTEIATVAIPGNHDLEGKEASSLGNAMQALDAIKGFDVCIKPTLVGDVWAFPWYQDLDVLRAEMISRADANLDAIIHAPVNGVIKGIPNHGLEASELAAMGYRRVFSGHYHDHKVMEDGKVISIGATSHQTWSDPGTKAGFLIVWEDRIQHVESLAPKFVDLNLDSTDDADVDGHYVRLKLDDVTDKEIKGWRDDLTKAGAKGVIVIATKKATTGRSGASTKAASSIDASVVHFIDNDMKPLLLAEVSALAMEVLNEARS